MRVNHNRGQRLQPLHGVFNAPGALLHRIAQQTELVVVRYAFRFRRVSNDPVSPRQALVPENLRSLLVAKLPLRRFVKDVQALFG